MIRKIIRSMRQSKIKRLLLGRLMSWLKVQDPSPNGLKSEDLRDIPDLSTKELETFINGILQSGGAFYPNQWQYETAGDVQARLKRERERQKLVDALNENPNFPYRAL